MAAVWSRARRHQHQHRRRRGRRALCRRSCRAAGSSCSRCTRRAATWRARSCSPPRVSRRCRRSQCSATSATLAGANRSRSAHCGTPISLPPLRLLRLRLLLLLPPVAPPLCPTESTSANCCRSTCLTHQRNPTPTRVPSLRDTRRPLPLHICSPSPTAASSFYA